MSETAAASRIVNDEVGGVAVIWAEIDAPPQATLRFRVGRADERVPQRSITHLLEHVALAELYREDLPMNGMVSTVFLEFTIEAEGDELTTLLGRLVSALVEPDPERIDSERRIIGTETQNEKLSATDRIMHILCGGRHYGLDVYSAYRLDTISGEELREWSTRWCTRDNAVLMLNRRPPDGLAEALAALPSGEWMAQPSPDELQPGLALPVQKTSQLFGGVDLGGVLPEESAILPLLWCLRNRGKRRLRHELGLSYSPWAASEWLDYHHVLVKFGSDCVEEHVVQVRDEWLKILDEIARDGATEEELERQRDLYRGDQDGDAEVLSADLERTAQATLMHSPVRTAAALSAEMEAMTGADVAAVARKLRDVLVLDVPEVPDVGRPEGFSSYDDRLLPSLAGSDPRQVRAENEDGETEALTMTTEGVSWQTGDEAPLVQRFDELVAVAEVEDGFELLGVRGTSITLQAGDWPNGAAIVDWVRQMIPAELVGPSRT